MEGFTKIEIAALRAFAEVSGEEELFLRWMGSAKVTERETTGSGFFTHFDTVFPKPQFRVSEDFRSDPISGPIFGLEGFGPDALIDFLLWDGVLEGYQLGGGIDGNELNWAELSGVWRLSWGPCQGGKRSTVPRET